MTPFPFFHARCFRHECALMLYFRLENFGAGRVIAGTALVSDFKFEICDSVPCERKVRTPQDSRLANGQAG